jgi:hypothetical protein
MLIIFYILILFELFYYIYQNVVLYCILKKNIKNVTNENSVIFDWANDKNALASSNFSNINNVNNFSIINNFYKFLNKNYNMNTLVLNNHFSIAYPLPFFVNIIGTIYINYCFNIYKKLGFKIIITNNSIFLEKINNRKKLLLIHAGINGFIDDYYKLLTLIKTDHSIIVSIHRSTIFNYYWKDATIENHVVDLYNIISPYKNVDVIAHSFGAYVIEYLYNFNDSTNNIINFTKEILVEPGNVLSMGTIFLKSNHTSFFSYKTFLNIFSNSYFMNYVIAYLINTFPAKSTIYIINTIKGIRMKPRDINGIIILSNNDPLINNVSHPFNHEISKIFNKHVIVNIPGYHGDASKNYDIFLTYIN